MARPRTPSGVPPGFRFQFSDEPLNLRHVLGIDVESVRRNLDIDPLQAVLPHLAYCTPREADFVGRPAAAVTRTIRIYQLLIQYLLSCQDHLQGQLETALHQAQRGGVAAAYGDPTELRVAALLDRLEGRLAALESRGRGDGDDSIGLLRAILQLSGGQRSGGGLLEERLVRLLSRGGRREKRRHTRSKSRHRRPRGEPPPEQPLFVGDAVTLAAHGEVFQGGCLVRGAVGVVDAVGREGWKPWANVVSADGRRYRYWQHDLRYCAPPPQQRGPHRAPSSGPGNRSIPLRSSVPRHEGLWHSGSALGHKLHPDDDFAEYSGEHPGVIADFEIPGSGGFAESPATVQARMNLASRRQLDVDPIALRSSSPGLCQLGYSWEPQWGAEALRLPPGVPLGEAQRAPPHEVPLPAHPGSTSPMSSPVTSTSSPPRRRPSAAAAKPEPKKQDPPRQQQQQQQQPPAPGQPPAARFLPVAAAAAAAVAASAASGKALSVPSGASSPARRGSGQAASPPTGPAPDPASPPRRRGSKQGAHAAADKGKGEGAQKPQDGAKQVDASPAAKDPERAKHRRGSAAAAPPVVQPGKVVGAPIKVVGGAAPAAAAAAAPAPAAAAAAAEPSAGNQGAAADAKPGEAVPKKDAGGDGRGGGGADKSPPPRSSGVSQEKAVAAAALAAAAAAVRSATPSPPASPQQAPPASPAPAAAPAAGAQPAQRPVDV